MRIGLISLVPYVSIRARASGMVLEKSGDGIQQVFRYNSD